MKIQWLGHSSFRILGSKTIVTDPYGEIGLRFPDVRADIVTVSHGHHDHNAVEAVKGEPAIVDDAGMHKIADLSIMGYNTAHDDEQGAKRGHNIVFVIQMDGTRVAHLGDIGCIPDHNVLGALQKVDVLLLPVGGNYTIDGEQAADLLEKQQFDLVLLDVMLPGVDGFALMDYIAPTGTPVIFLTAKNAVADRVRGLKLGAYDYIVKPFAPAELLARVEGLLRHTGRRAATLRVFDAEVDPDNRTVTQNGRTVELTPREFTLLLVLVRARGQALYRDILYERVWGPDAEPNPRALDLHIHRLRKKLDWADKIVTVPKVGYKLLAER